MEGWRITGSLPVWRFSLILLIVAWAVLVAGLGAGASAEADEVPPPETTTPEATGPEATTPEPTDPEVTVPEAEALEAESMVGSGQVFPDTSASNEQGRLFDRNRSASRQFTGLKDELTVRAKGAGCGGAPRLVVKVDGEVVMSRLVTSRRVWKDYTASVDVSDGYHDLTTSFVNNRRTKSCDRDLRVDKITLSKKTPSPSLGSSVPAAPSALTAKAASSTSVDLTWTDNATNEDTYVVERSSNGNDWSTVSSSLAADATSYSNTGLRAAATYYFRVRAANVRGGSGYSNVSSATTPAGQIEYSSPVTITKGGTYSGNWMSDDPNVPAVLVKTTEPVTIQNSNVKGRGHLIKSYGTTNITVRNTSGYGLNPNVAGKFPGRFFHSENFSNVVLENNYFEGTSGIYLRKYMGNGTANNTVKIFRNSAKNIDGRYSDGAGGFSETQFYRVQFVQLNDVDNVPGLEIAWNQVINEPGKSRAEDNISVYLSKGTSADPIRIHDNYIHGAFPARAATDSYSGGGILTDGKATDVASATGFVEIYNNQVVGVANYGLGVYSGHDVKIFNNRVVSSSRLADGSPIAAANVGIYVADMSNQRSYGTWFNNHAYGNVIGYVNEKPNYAYSGFRNDMWLPIDGSDRARNSFLPNPVTHVTETQERNLWEAKLVSAGISVGPRTATP